MFSSMFYSFFLMPYDICTLFTTLLFMNHFVCWIFMAVHEQCSILFLVTVSVGEAESHRMCTKV